MFTWIKKQVKAAVDCVVAVCEKVKSLVVSTKDSKQFLPTVTKTIATVVTSVTVMYVTYGLIGVLLINTLFAAITGCIIVAVEDFAGVVSAFKVADFTSPLNHSA